MATKGIRRGGVCVPSRSPRGDPRGAATRPVVSSAGCGSLYQAVSAGLLVAAGPWAVAAARPPLPADVAAPSGRQGGPAAAAGAQSGSTRCRSARSGWPPSWPARCRRELPLLVTTVTPTGQERARALLAERAEFSLPAVRARRFVGRFSVGTGPRRWSSPRATSGRWCCAAASRSDPGGGGQRPGQRPELPPPAASAPLARPAARPGRPLRRADPEDRRRLSSRGRTGARRW